MEQERRRAAEQAHEQSLVHEGPADEGVGGSHHTHDGDFLPAVEGGQADGVGDDERAHQEQGGNQRHGHHGSHVADSQKTVGHILVGVYVRHALYRRHLVHRLRQMVQRVQPEGVAVPEDGRVQVLKQVLVRVLLREALHGLLTGDERGGGHVGRGQQLGFQSAGLFRGVELVHEGHNLIGVL